MYQKVKNMKDHQVRQQQQKRQIVLLIHIGSVLGGLFGVAILTNWENLATIMGLNEQLRQVVGGAFIVISAIEIMVVIPFLKKSIDKNKE